MIAKREVAKRKQQLLAQVVENGQYKVSEKGLSRASLNKGGIKSLKTSNKLSLSSHTHKYKAFWGIKQYINTRKHDASHHVETGDLMNQGG